ncbi:MAG: DUF262 domain-containing protein [Candidatus Binatus sp.]|nr:DUF262 domain-containing protein [Candidatus Binatus sp.]
MTPDKRAIDKIFRRRDRYEIPDWQRQKVWSKQKKQGLIDSILRGWKLPKFYFVKSSDENFLVEDGQQRLTAIFEFFSGDLGLSQESAEIFGGTYYSELKRNVADAFDDFDIEYDVIEDATDKELKEFFQRLQEGMPLTGSEKLNAVPSKLRDFCKETAAKHPFFKETIAVPDTRYAHFDVLAKVVTIELEDLDTGLRLDDVKAVFEANQNFATTSAVAKRIKNALDLLATAFKGNGSILRTRTMVQSLITLTCEIVSTKNYAGIEALLREFCESFTTELAAQIDKGQEATDSDYVQFQKSVSANVTGAARTRQEILLRKLFTIAPELSAIFDPSVIAESGTTGRITAVSDSIILLIEQINKKHAAATGDDLFKATNKTALRCCAFGSQSRHAMLTARSSMTSISSFGRGLELASTRRPCDRSSTSTTYGRTCATTWIMETRARLAPSGKKQAQPSRSMPARERRTPSNQPSTHYSKRTSSQQ